MKQSLFQLYGLGRDELIIPKSLYKGMQYILPQNKNFTLFIIGYTIPEIKSYVGMLNFVSWGVSL